MASEDINNELKFHQIIALSPDILLDSTALTPFINALDTTPTTIFHHPCDRAFWAARIFTRAKGQRLGQKVLDTIADKKHITTINMKECPNTRGCRPSKHFCHFNNKKTIKAIQKLLRNDSVNTKPIIEQLPLISPQIILHHHPQNRLFPDLQHRKYTQNQNQHQKSGD